MKKYVCTAGIFKDKANVLIMAIEIIVMIMICSTRKRNRMALTPNKDVYLC